jgi:putative transposase
MLHSRQMGDVKEVRLRPRQPPHHFSLERDLVDRQTYKERRSTALAEWQSLAG